MERPPGRWESPSRCSQPRRRESFNATGHPLKHRLIALGLILLVASQSWLSSASPCGLQTVANVDAQVDRLFAQWNSLDRPGCAVAVIQNGGILYAKGYGSADLQHGIANSPSTDQVGSVPSLFGSFGLSAFPRARFREALHQKLEQFSGGLKADCFSGVNLLDRPDEATPSHFRSGTEPYHEGCLHDGLRIGVLEIKGMTVPCDFCDDSVDCGTGRRVDIGRSIRTTGLNCAEA